MGTAFETASPRVGGGVLRRPLLDRVQAAQPAIVSLIAPAGFGKSTFVRQLLEAAPAVAVCDCRGVGSDLDLARRVLPALADENPGRSANLAQSETMLGDGHASTGDRLGVALAAWRTQTNPGVFVFENAEDAIADRGARDYLARLLLERPTGRRIIISSREALRMHLSRFAPPHAIVSLRASDLAFDHGEIATIFAGSGASDATIERVATISGGWPIAVLLLARFANEGRLDALLDRLDDVAYEELHDYLADEVLGTIPHGVADALLACSAFPDANDRDLRLVVGEADLAAFVAFAKTSPFVLRSGDGRTTVHPLLASMLLERRPERVDELLRPAAAAYETTGEWQRAAEIHLACGDQQCAAEALNHVDVIEDEAPSIGYARVLASLDRAVIVRHPRLWAVTALLRMFTVDSRSLLDEAETLWQRLPPGASPEVRIYLYVFRMLLMSHVGEFVRALALIDEFRVQVDAPEVPTTRMHAWLLYLRSLMTARMGRLGEAERDLENAWPFLHGMHVTASEILVTLGADIARVRGDRALERERIERGIEHARASGLSTVVAFARAEATFGAWLAGDEAAYTHHAFTLETEVERDGLRGFAFFAACARGHRREPKPADHPKWLVCGHLIAAARAEDAADAMRHADSARAAAARYRAPYYQVLAAIAVAQLDAQRRRAMLAEAAAIATHLDAPALQRAIAGTLAGEDEGILAAFVRRFHRDAPSSRGGLEIELVTGRVVRDGVAVTLPEREHALLTAIALRPETVMRERLTDMLWPDLDDTAARNAFHVCLHRVKARLGDEHAIVRNRDGYRLGDDVGVDLWEIDRTAAAVRSAEHLDDAQIATVRELYERLRASRPPTFEQWEWFEPIERRLRELRCEVAQMLAKHALDDGRAADALALAHEMIAYDPCDEPAREIAIRAYLETGDRAAALRHFRQYRDTLMAELQCEPSETLAELVAAS